ncbi:hypothetical protein BSS2_I0614 [Brucella suis bv. 1 str. S2]|uniref:Uncharacterized protein n=5 Tax=Brucella TaxID=234 RepID=Q2YMZ3_BRUA2|nr:hypothetical protein BR0632 [Brucella suis 1330]AAX74025.1 hypothetical protein BruAb1_0650 [Brucella abortus bv. 1 str. 9-941]ACO00435.1 Hypothetical protein, conserved [Brucella melitensis ATCC 23457]ACU47630.1 hypothetical protein BMI_I631 [Brucella microti CCM 4915]ADZ86593.1 conserved hypothetical protein [Brucella melitensis M5-90]AEK53966.1 hypothetical protein BPI_I668 [Brucella pinnipedialis B2/94]AEU05646.1 hypothetical protein BSVBI22_A0628 [Brucella suis VBI22]AHN46270.1 hypot
MRYLARFCCKVRFSDAAAGDGHDSLVQPGRP